MKIIFEPTSAGGRVEERSPRVELMQPGDDLNIQQVGDLIKAALLAWGFHGDTVSELFNTEDE